MGFDSEAAATEVMRVRKSLAEKREARFLLLDQEGPAVEAGPDDRAPDPQPAMVDPWNVPGEGAYSEAPPSFDIDIHFTLPDDPEASDARHEPEQRPGPDDFLDAIELDFNLDDPGPAVQQDLESVAVEAAPELAVTGPVAPDYATTLALAQVSEELEQLNEARDLAHEVLQSDDPALQNEARALLDRLSEVESEMGPESIRWDDLR
jgi:FimV-like protein